MCEEVEIRYKCGHQSTGWIYCPKSLDVKEVCENYEYVGAENDSNAPCPLKCLVDPWCCCLCFIAHGSNFSYGTKCRRRGCGHERCPNCDPWLICKCDCLSEHCRDVRGYSRLCDFCFKRSCGGNQSHGLDEVLTSIQQRMAQSQERTARSEID